MTLGSAVKTDQKQSVVIALTDVTTVMYTEGEVSVLDRGQSVQLDCTFSMPDFSHFDNPVVWKKSQRHEHSLINVLATIEPPFLDTNRFRTTFQVLQPTKFCTSLVITS